MEFGPEIKVDGVRPEWLDGYNGPVRWWNEDQPKGITCDTAATLNWGPYLGYTRGAITSFALPANHPHYNLITHTYTVRPEDEAALLASDPLSRSTPDERAGIEVGPQGTWHPCSSEASTPDERAVAPELVERMRALVKTIGNDNSEPYSLRHVEDEARAILAALEPVDADLAVAREICAEQSIATEHYDDQLSKDLANAFRRGSYDEGREMRIALNSLARGRQLEKEGK